MSPKAAAKQPQDHKKKAVDQLQAEASKIPGIAETEDKTVTVVGRLGTVSVHTLNMIEWDAEVPSLLREGDYLAAVCGMVTAEDGQRLRAAKPTLGAMMTAMFSPDEKSGETSLGESEAS